MQKKKRTNKIMLGVIAGLAVLLLVMTLISRHMTGSEAVPEAEVTIVERGALSEELDAAGTVKSMKRKSFFSPVNATIKKLDFQVGDLVKEGKQLIAYDLDGLEQENQKAELNVLSGQLDYQDSLKQADLAVSKQAAAEANARFLEAQVDEWQQYVYDLQDAIAEAGQEAQLQAAYLQEQAAAEAQGIYQQQLQEYQKAGEEYDRTADTLLERKLAALADYNSACTAYDMEKNEVNATAMNDAEIAYEKAANEYDRHLASPVDISDYVSSDSGSGGASLNEAAAVETAELQQELERAGSILAELQGELASEKAVAEADAAVLSAEAKSRMEVANNLTELEAKSVEELLAEGKKGIQAEFTGVISAAQVAEGGAVTQGMELFTLESTEDVGVEISVSKHDYAKLQEGQQAEIELGGATYRGTVTRISRVAVRNDKGMPMIDAMVRIDDPDERIFIGVDAGVTVQTASVEEALLLPVEAVNIGNDGSFCYVLRKGVVTRQPVETGISSDSYIEIRSGLKEGEQVLAELGELEEGDRARAAEGDVQ